MYIKKIEIWKKKTKIKKKLKKVNKIYSDKVIKKQREIYFIFIINFKYITKFINLPWTITKSNNKQGYVYRKIANKYTEKVKLKK